MRSSDSFILLSCIENELFTVVQIPSEYTVDGLSQGLGVVTHPGSSVAGPHKKSDWNSGWVHLGSELQIEVRAASG